MCETEIKLLFLDEDTAKSTQQKIGATPEWKQCPGYKAQNKD